MRRRSVATITAIVGFACAAAMAGCTTASPIAARSTIAPPDDGPPYALRLLGHRTLDTKEAFGGTIVGGLSGIDYDVGRDLYYVISDDRGQHGPTRFYTARLALDDHGLHDVALRTVVPLLRPDGSPLAVDEADAEAVRYDPTTDTLWWSSEGGRRPDGRPTDPFVREAALDGRARSEVPLDAMFRFGPRGHGPRGNLTFEGLSLSPDRRSLWVAMEGPLVQDGPMPTMTDGAFVRFSRHPRRSDGGFAALDAQYAYPVSPIPSAGAWTARHAQTGVSEVLEIEPGHLLVVERAVAIGTGWRIRLFDAQWASATDVRTIESLARGHFVPMAKRLVLDFDDLGFRVDNLEGLCFGPTLPNGHRTLVLVSDDNFNPGEVTQFVALEVVPGR